MEKINNYEELLPLLPPRLRSVGLMINTKPVMAKNKRVTKDIKIYNRFVGRNILYIRTRCGGKGTGGRFYKTDSSYYYFGMDEWEKSFGIACVAAVDDYSEPTYRETYIDLDKLKDLEEYKKKLGQIPEWVLLKERKEKELEKYLEEE